MPTKKRPRLEVFFVIINYMDEAAKAHLSLDPVMKNLLDNFTIKEYWGQQQNYFLDLIEIVTGQQLSMKAAKSIFDRFLSLYPQTPTPKVLVTTSNETLRSVGFSKAKALYVKNIAQAILDRQIDPDSFDRMSDEDITKNLIKIKGIGPWSVEMFLIFTLHRPDIFSVGDLGIRSAIEKLYGLDRNDKKGIVKLSQNWSPFRTHACRLLWMSLE